MMKFIKLFSILCALSLLSFGCLNGQSIVLDGACINNGPETLPQDGTFNGKPAYTGTVDFGTSGSVTIAVYWLPATGNDPTVWVVGDDQGGIFYFIESTADAPPGTFDFTYETGPDAGLTGCADVSQLVVEGDVTLPVAWLSFSATDLAKQGVALNWATSQESDNAGFTVLRGLAGTNDWVELGYVSATPASSNAYQFIDQTAPASGSLLYRLRQEDHDGTIGFSEIRSVDRWGTPGYRVYPNPVGGEDQLQLSGDWDLTREFSIVDNLGRIVNQQKALGQQIQIAELEPGVFYLSQTIQNKRITIRFIRQ